MSTVYKYRLTPGSRSVVEMPKYATILHVGSQDDGPVLWARVEDRPLEQREFYVYGTGHPIDDTIEMRFVGTCQTESGFVWHVFEKPIERNIGELLIEMLDAQHGRAQE